MKMTKGDTKGGGGSQYDASSWRYGFPMDFKAYSNTGIRDGIYDGVVLAVFTKDDKDRSKPMTSSAGDPMIRVVLGFEAPGAEGGRVQVPFWGVIGTGFYNNFLEFVLPEEWAKVCSLADGQEYDVKDGKARGRLIRAEIENRQAPNDGEWRPSLKKFHEVNKARLDLGPDHGKPASAAAAAEEPVENPYAMAMDDEDLPF